MNYDQTHTHTHTQLGISPSPLISKEPFMKEQSAKEYIQWEQIRKKEKYACLF